MSWGDVVRDGRWLEFDGLPRRLDEAGLLRELGREAQAHAGRPANLGRHGRTLVELDGLRYWLAGRRVVLVELEDPASSLAPGELLSALGAADREGAGRYRRVGATTTEHVFAGRGLALTVAESYDDPPSFAPILAAVQLFVPTDLRGFILELGGDDRGGPRF